MKVLSKNSVMEFVKKTAILWVMIILILILSCLLYTSDAADD